ncbi:MAG: aminopeptidase N [Candidatus Gracilibacteria bacterium]|nr:aminopeptidase N [Candidatus Gracilibacteria bacterium]
MVEKKVTYLADYKVSNYLVEKINLQFDIFGKFTLVENEAFFYRNKKSEEKGELVLDGEELNLVDIFLDDKILEKTEYKIEGEKLTILNSPDKFKLKIITKNQPEKNTKLMGLYKSKGIYCTQCESEGFRRITYYLDRPDVLTKFSVKITADKKTNPVLLSNGNKIDSGDLEKNRHFVVWQDPFPKPCYLFALVAGNLANIEDEFITMSGKKVKLQIFTEKHNIKKTPFAMESLRKSMLWDEVKFGREYDLDIFMIVAVDDFNSGAMENKGLNIFNSAACFATENTATDEDFKRVERVIAHEYFHNWTGDRVTCRDWFQLSLKEGLTVYRDQEFTSDMHDRDVTRIQNVRALRNGQFKEDAGPMAHSIRPNSYEEISNFYTSTVYSKGAEVIGIYKTILGEEGFRKGMDLYFETFDGQAVTTEDFLRSMEIANNSPLTPLLTIEGNKVDLSKMKKWYEQAGTPVVDIISNYDEETKDYTLFFRQTCRETPETDGQKKPFLIPIKYGLLDRETKKEIKSGTFILDDYQDRLVIKNIETNPIASLFRDFSAPIKLNYAFTEEKLDFLTKYDTNNFNRFEAFQIYIKDIVIENYECQNLGKYKVDQRFLDLFKYILEENNLSNSFKAEILKLPSVGEIAEIIEKNIDYVVISEIKNFLEDIISRTFEEDFLNLYKELNKKTGYLQGAPLQYSIDIEIVGNRSLKKFNFKIYNNCISI